MTAVTFFVPGIPATAGSKRGFPVRRRDGSTGVGMAPDNPRARPWMAAIASAALCDQFFTGPVRLELVFTFLRPASHFGSGRNRSTLKPSAPRFHTQRPDVDKLTRCTADALKSVLWRDDAQVAELRAFKRWTRPGEPAGAHVRITDLQLAPREAPPLTFELDLAVA